ncbi:MAG: protein phosphatase 2C domain-containing protein [Candidatus Margulisiibacteriota bacterium]
MFGLRINRLVCGGANSKRVYTARRGALAAYTNQAGRAENQDGFLALKRGPELFLAVADGMGGHAGGREASKFALQTLQHSLAAGSTPDNALHLANLKVIDAAKTDPALAKMGSTLTAAQITGGSLRLCHVGDSRAYLVDRNGTIDLLTRDHSSSFEMYELFTPGFALPRRDPENVYEILRTHSRSNPIYSYLGLLNTEVFTADHGFPVGARLLLASDGLNYLPYRELKMILQGKMNPKQTVLALMKAVRTVMEPLNAAGIAADNVTILLYENR